MNDFFKDLKVVELASVLAGPAVGTFFSELGANVTKIENKLSNGDVTRSWKLESENKDSAMSAYYASVNWNKKSVFLDLTDENEKKQVYDLIKDADVVISNYKPGDDIKLQMDYKTFKKINPTLIYAHLTGFGDNSSRTAYDLVLQAEAGFMHINGTEQSGPLKMPIAIIDMMAAHQMKEAILIALIKKLKTGGGSKISVSLFDSAIASLANQASSWLMLGNDPKAIGSLHPSIAPYGEIFTTGDEKKIVLAVGNNKQFEHLCSILNLPQLLSDIKFAKNRERVINRKALFEMLQSAIKTKNADELMSSLILKDVPAGHIRSIKEVFESADLSASVLTEIDNNNIKSHRVKTTAFKISD